MPTYEYRCPDGHEFEKFVQKMSDAQSELTCPTCGKLAPRRMSAGGGLLFKGSGFYITDYGKDGKKDQRAAASAESSKGDAAKAPAADAGGGSTAGAGGAGSTASSPGTGASASGTAGGTGSPTKAKGTTTPAAPASRSDKSSKKPGSSP